MFSLIRQLKKLSIDANFFRNSQKIGKCNLSGGDKIVVNCADSSRECAGLTDGVTVCGCVCGSRQTQCLQSWECTVINTASKFSAGRCNLPEEETCLRIFTSKICLGENWFGMSPAGDVLAVDAKIK